MAIGETGLDKAIKIPLEIQEDIFRAHTEISEEFKKPLIIHCVRAYNLIVRLKKDLKPRSSWIIHGYHGSEQLTRELINHGFYLSVNERILKFPEQGKQLLQNIPPDRLFLETDEYESPVQELYRFAAKAYLMKPEEFRTKIRDNFFSVFEC
jgi:TatD DNase family protein